MNYLRLALTSFTLACPVAAQNLVNLSALAQAGGSTPLTSGFVVSGGTKTVLIRAIGPTLATFGVSGVLPHPVLNVFASGNPTPITSDDTWGGGSSLASVFTQVGAFALPANSLDAALVVALPPGQYSAQVTAAGGASGMCLMEIYDVSGAGAQLSNLSTLLPVGATPPTFGFVVSPGTGSRRLLIRADGPALTSFGIGNVLSDPNLTVIAAASQQTVAQNNDWSSGNVTSLSLAFTSAGAFPFANPSRDAAVVADFAPGNYGVVVAGNGGATGTALVEIYDITPTGVSQVSVTAVNGSGANGGSFTLSRTGDLTLPLAVSYTIAGSAVPGTDYAALGGTAIIPAGAASVPVPLTLYPTTNPNVSATVTLTAVAGSGYALSSSPAATVTFAPMAATLYTAVLRPPSSASGSTASGTATILVGPNNTIGLVSVTFSNLSSPEVVAHLEIGIPGQNASYVLALTSGQVSDQVWTFAPTGPYQAGDLATALQSGQIFVEVDSSNYPAGELTGGFLKATGSQTFTAPPAPPSLPASALGPNTDATNAVRFLTQATFGPTSADVATVMSEGVSAWITNQLALPQTSLLAAVRAGAATFPNPQSPTAANYYYVEPVNLQAAWWKNALTAPDQLRQRVAFALSELLVVSEQNAGLNKAQEPLAKYYDLLAADAFGNFRQLIEDVTLSPVMGTYLSSLHNQAGNAALGTSADENYAREVQQLFTIGLVELQPDGTLQLDATGQPIPTYNQTEITQTAKVFTGWAFASPTGNFYFNPNANNAYAQVLPDTSAWLNPMQAYPAYHDTTAKTIVNGTVIPAGGTAQGDLKIELDALFNHPNTGPFVAKALIQRLVTSNPSPGYVYRVAQVFANDGTGTRGNLGAVVKAILTDYEARSATVTADAGYGKLREPLLRMSALLRAFNVTSQNGRYIELVPNGTTNNGILASPMGDFEEEALDANTVFNFFAPSFIEPGPLASAGLVAPEFQITDAASSIDFPNVLFTFVFNRQAPQPSNLLLLDFSALTPNAGNPSALLDQLNPLICNNAMSAATKTRLVAALQAMPASVTPAQLVQNAIYLIVTCPECAIQR